MKIKIVFSIALMVLILSCSKSNEEKKVKVEAQNNNAHQATVLEVIQVSDYTYLRVNENENEYWIAAPKADIKLGTVITFNQSMEMKNFESKELKRKFDKILFVDNLDAKLGVGSMDKPIKPTIEKENVNVEKLSDGITISELFANLSKYENKTVKIRGKVVKINTGIMNRNWIHIQDGTKYNEDYDLTVTTNQIVNKDDVVTVIGKIVLNKDFGYGYSYKVIMEDAKIEGSLTKKMHTM